MTVFVFPSFWSECEKMKICVCLPLILGRIKRKKMQICIGLLFRDDNTQICVFLLFRGEKFKLRSSFRLCRERTNRRRSLLSHAEKVIISGRKTLDSETKYFASLNCASLFSLFRVYQCPYFVISRRKTDAKVRRLLLFRHEIT